MKRRYLDVMDIGYTKYKYRKIIKNACPICLSKVLRKVKPDLCFENLSWQLKISKQNFGQGKRGHNFSCSMGKV